MKDFQGLQANNLFNNLSKYVSHSIGTFVLPKELIYLFVVAVIVLTVLIIIRKLLQVKMALKEQSILLELTPPSFTEQKSYTTDQLFSIIHALGNQRSFKDGLLGIKPRFSLEIVSTYSQGIRYVVRSSPKLVNTLEKSLLSYLPHLKVKTINEYLPENSTLLKKYFYKVTEFKLSKHFAFSLKSQSQLDKHDPIAYLTGMMTKLTPGELISLQVVVTPTKNKDTKKISKLISANGNVIKYIRTPFFLKWMLYNSYRIPTTKSPSEMEAVALIDSKINQSLFDTSIRLLMVFKDKSDLSERERGFKSSFTTFSANGYQSLVTDRYPVK